MTSLEPMLTVTREDINGMEPAIGGADPFDAKLEALEAKAQELYHAWGERRTVVAAEAKAEFVAAGGCPECLGAGGVSHHYHDGDSQWYSCCRSDPKPFDSDRHIVAGPCTPEARRQSGVLNTDNVANTDAEVIRLGEERKAVNAEIRDMQESRRIAIGRRVVVISGRKVRKGTAGTVVSINDFHLNIGYRGKTVTKVAFVDFDGKTHETSIDNLKCLGTPAPTDPDAKAATAQDEFKKGDRVRVVREIVDTRNNITHPVGCEGIVFWTGLGRGGKRLGFRDSTATVRWANCSDLEIVK